MTDDEGNEALRKLSDELKAKGDMGTADALNALLDECEPARKLAEELGRLGVDQVTVKAVKDVGPGLRMSLEDAPVIAKAIAAMREEGARASHYWCVTCQTDIWLLLAAGSSSPGEERIESCWKCKGSDLDDCTDVDCVCRIF